MSRRTSSAVEWKVCGPLSDDPDVRRAPSKVIWFPWTRSRFELIGLFKLADDSVQQIREYLHLGEVIVAMSHGRLVGHAQIVSGSGPGEYELKSLAVIEEERRQGIGSKLLDAAVDYCRESRGRRLNVSTAIASSAAIRFYLRRGFRPLGIARDAYAPTKGYPPNAQLDGIPLLDAVLLELALEPRSDMRDGVLRLSDRRRQLDQPIGRCADQNGLELPIQPGQDK